jgi:LacI family transcriptional regulator
VSAGPPRRAPLLKDVATAAGVHISTASRALDERTAPHVNAETVERVRQAADNLGYRVNGMARALRRQRSLIIGMVIPDINSPVFPAVVRGAEDVLAGLGYSLLLSSTDSDPAKARAQITAMLASRADGLLLGMAQREDPVVDEFIATGTPVVLVNRMIDRGGVPTVIADDYHGILAAVEHLHGLGHRKIGYIGGPSNLSTASQRLAAFEHAARRLGLPDAGVIETAVFGEEAGLAAGTQLLDAHPEVTAVVAANDLIAIGVIDAAARRGLSCPRDISVVGFNDIPYLRRLQPPLTTIRIPHYEVGRRAAELLLAMVEDPGRHPETVMLAGELVVRGSTTRPRKRR